MHAPNLITRFYGICSLIVCLISFVVGVPQTFTVSVTALRNLPLDLYILMDLSFSMSDELNTVKSVADQIGKLRCAPSGFFAQVGGGAIEGYYWGGQVRICVQSEWYTRGVWGACSSGKF